MTNPWAHRGDDPRGSRRSRTRCTPRRRGSSPRGGVARLVDNGRKVRRGRAVSVRARADDVDADDPASALLLRVVTVLRRPNLDRPIDLTQRRAPVACVLVPVALRLAVSVGRDDGRSGSDPDDDPDDDSDALHQMPPSV